MIDWPLIVESLPAYWRGLQISLLLMRRAGYETRAAAQVWTNLRDELKAGAGGDPAKRSVMFATHPANCSPSRSIASALNKAWLIQPSRTPTTSRWAWPPWPP